MNHGGPVPLEDDEVAVVFGPDPELANIRADLSAWLAAHPEEEDD
jgi:hypothetical protein